MVQDHVGEFNAALKADLNRPSFEVSFMETSICLNECADAVANIYKWTKTSKPPFNLTWTPMNPYLRREPKGVVLVIIPFNVPLYLTVSPLVRRLSQSFEAVHGEYRTWAVDNSVTKTSIHTHWFLY
jgi:aldehyde dehydrogenase (NAD+)